MNLKLRQERLRRDWTQEYVAKKTDVTKATIQMIETRRRKPSYDVLVKLLELFGYDDPRQLFAVVDEAPISQVHHSTKKQKRSSRNLKIRHDREKPELAKQQ